MIRVAHIIYSSTADYLVSSTTTAVVSTSSIYSYTYRSPSKSAVSKRQYILLLKMCDAAICNSAILLFGGYGR